MHMNFETDFLDLLMSSKLMLKLVNKKGLKLFKQQKICKASVTY